MKRFTLLLLSTLTYGCNGGDDPDSEESGNDPAATNDGCTVTFSGAYSETKDCLMFLNQIGSNTNPEPYVGGGTLDGLFGFNIFDVPVATGTYTSGGSYVATGLLHDRVPMPSNLPQSWKLSDNQDPMVDTGSYEMRITARSDSMSFSGVTQWAIDGTLDATYTADVSTGAMDPVTIHMEF